MHEIILPETGTPEIQVKTPVGQVDLHNFAFFTGLRYESDSTLKLSWKLIGDDNSRLDGRPVDWVQLNFSGVSHLNVSPHDPAVPREEDMALEHYQLVERGPDSIHLAFEFVGGSTITVIARQVNLSARHSLTDLNDKLRELESLDLGRIADALHRFWELPVEMAYDVAFHLGDAGDDWKRLLPMLQEADEFTDDELGEEILNMIIHTPNHLMAAAHLMGHTPTDVWGLGITVVPESSS